MVSAILGMLPLGLGIALNPIAIGAGILILSTARPRVNGLLFAIGWILGLLLLIVLSSRFVLLQRAEAREAGRDLPSVIWVAIGALVLLAAVRAIRGRPLPGEAPVTPRWLRAIDTAGPVRIFGIGLVLAMVSLRNLALLAAAAAAIGGVDLGLVEWAVAVASFLVVSSIGILVPLLVRLFGGEEADATLAGWSMWLNRHVATITAGVLGVIGMYLLSRGVAGVL